MKIVVQRVNSASVSIDGQIKGQIGQGYVLLVGISIDDTMDDVTYCVRKVAGLRIFEDDQDKMNLSLKDVGGSILSISQFTLYGDTKKGNRPSFTMAARPELAQPLYDAFNQGLKDAGFHVETGIFQTHMHVALVNDGPVTIIIESKKEQ